MKIKTTLLKSIIVLELSVLNVFVSHLIVETIKTIFNL